MFGGGGGGGGAADCGSLLQALSWRGRTPSAGRARKKRRGQTPSLPLGHYCLRSLLPIESLEQARSAVEFLLVKRVNRD